ncbi:MAG: hypothetical protein ACP5SH_22840 [Syntrophobacteraceae bacterium]
MSLYKNIDRELLTSILVVSGLSIGVVVWALVLYFTVGYKWPPHWDTGSVPSIPGESRYSTSGGLEYPGLGSHPFLQKGRVPKQHVGRAEGEPVIPGEEKK